MIDFCWKTLLEAAFSSAIILHTFFHVLNIYLHNFFKFDMRLPVLQVILQLLCQHFSTTIKAKRFPFNYKISILLFVLFIFLICLNVARIFIPFFMKFTSIWLGLGSDLYLDTPMNKPLYGWIEP